MINATDLEATDASSRERVATRALSATIVVLLLAATVAAVVISGGDEPKAVPLATIQAAAESATSAKTATVEVTTTFETDTVISETHTTMRSDNEARTGELRMVSGFGPMKMPEAVALIAGDRFVLSVPPDAGQISGGKAWLGATVPRGAFGSPDDPMQTGGNLLAMLAGAEGDVEVVGTDKIRGVDTTRYRVLIDVVRAQQEGAEKRSALGFPTPPPTADQPSVAPADVWLDDEGRLRRLTMTLADEDADEGDTAAADPKGFTIRMQIDVYDYDKPVSVTLPPADQVHQVATVNDAFTALYTKYAMDMRPASA